MTVASEQLLLMYFRVIKQCSVLTFIGRITEFVRTSDRPYCFCLHESGHSSGAV